MSSSGRPGYGNLALAAALPVSLGRFLWVDRSSPSGPGQRHPWTACRPSRPTGSPSSSCAIVALTVLVVGVQHYWLYIRRAQGTAFKYNRDWPDGRNPVLHRRHPAQRQPVLDLLQRAADLDGLGGVSLWFYANGHIAGLRIAENPVWFFVLWFFVPLLHEFHFYCVHRLIHWPPLYNGPTRSTIATSTRGPGRACRCTPWST